MNDKPEFSARPSRPFGEGSIASSRLDTSEKQTLVEEGTEFTGTMKAKCKVVIRGSVEGELHAPSVNITRTGVMTGNVVAQTVESSGVLSGRVDADEISLAGEVRSSTVIRAKTLEVKLASEKGKLEVTFGDCVLDVGDMPTDRPADSDAATAMSEEGRRRGRKGKGDGKGDPEPAPSEGAPVTQ
jgi:cytoskeletal protein CcmA (bactofilin family)